MKFIMIFFYIPKRLLNTRYKLFSFISFFWVIPFAKGTFMALLELFMPSEAIPSALASMLAEEVWWWRESDRLLLAWAPRPIGCDLFFRILLLCRRPVALVLIDLPLLHSGSVRLLWYMGRAAVARWCQLPTYEFAIAVSQNQLIFCDFFEFWSLESTTELSINLGVAFPDLYEEVCTHQWNYHCKYSDVFKGKIKRYLICQEISMWGIS